MLFKRSSLVTIPLTIREYGPKALEALTCHLLSVTALNQELRDNIKWIISRLCDAVSAPGQPSSIEDNFFPLQSILMDFFDWVTRSAPGLIRACRKDEILHSINSTVRSRLKNESYNSPEDLVAVFHQRYRSHLTHLTLPLQPYTVDDIAQAHKDLQRERILVNKVLYPTPSTPDCPEVGIWDALRDEIRKVLVFLFEIDSLELLEPHIPSVSPEHIQQLGGNGSEEPAPLNDFSGDDELTPPSISPTRTSDAAVVVEEVVSPAVAALRAAEEVERHLLLQESDLEFAPEETSNALPAEASEQRSSPSSGHSSNSSESYVAVEHPTMASSTSSAAASGLLPRRVSTGGLHGNGSFGTTSSENNYPFRSRSNSYSNHLPHGRSMRSGSDSSAGSGGQQQVANSLGNNNPNSYNWHLIRLIQRHNEQQEQHQQQISPQSSQQPLSSSMSPRNHSHSITSQSPRRQSRQERSSSHPPQVRQMSDTSFFSAATTTSNHSIGSNVSYLGPEHCYHRHNPYSNSHERGNASATDQLSPRAQQSAQHQLPFHFYDARFIYADLLSVLHAHTLLGTARTFAGGDAFILLNDLYGGDGFMLCNYTPQRRHETPRSRTNDSKGCSAEKDGSEVKVAITTKGIKVTVRMQYSLYACEALETCTSTARLAPLMCFDCTTTTLLLVNAEVLRELDAVALTQTERKEVASQTDRQQQRAQQLFHILVTHPQRLCHRAVSIQPFLPPHP